MTRERLVPLEGGFNFRDLGGYKAHDGGTVRWKHIYRSGKLSDLTPADCALIRDLGIHSVIDFRRMTERNDEPSLWHEDHTPNVITQPHPLDEDESVPRIMGQLITLNQDAREVMLEIYRHLPEEHAAHYAEMFRCLTDEAAGPLLIHCTAGKDRTGVGAALVLFALGVDQDQIFEDYLLTNAYYPADERLQRILQSVFEKFGIELEDKEKFRPVVEVDADYLHQSFKRIETEFGSVETYLERALGVGPREQAMLRARLLE